MKTLTIILLLLIVSGGVMGQSNADSLFITGSGYRIKTIDFNQKDTIGATLLVPTHGGNNDAYLRVFFGYIVIKKYATIVMAIGGKNHYMNPIEFLDKNKKHFILPVIYWMED